MKWQPPEVQLMSIETCDEWIFTQVKFKIIPSLPIAPGFLGETSDPFTDPFELHRVQKIDDNIIYFQTFDIDAKFLTEKSKYAYWQLWTPRQLEYAQTDSNVWRFKRFNNSDLLGFTMKDSSMLARKLQPNENIKQGFIVENGWNHEHCELCWKTISELEGYDHFGYEYNSHWVCKACFIKYILSGFGKKLGQL